MAHNHLPLRGHGRVGLSLLVGSLVLAGPVRGRADAPGAPAVDPGRAPLIPRDLVAGAGTPSPSPPSPPAARLRLFRIQPGFLSDPVGLEPGDDAPGEAGPDRVTFAFGQDNPHFDFRRRTDPGGVGFTRVNTQVLLFDTAATAFSVGLQAVTPAGLECDGLPEGRGATVVTPAVSVFHALDDHLALQAFVGKHLPLMNRGAAPARADLQYGLALQGPVFLDGPGSQRGLFVSVGALGQLRQERDARAPLVWEVMPGLHYRMADNWWISGGVSMPVGPSGVDGAQQWQVTCSLQF